MLKFGLRAVLAATSCFAFLVPITSYAAPPAKAFGELPVGFDADISPNGQQLAVIVNVNGVYNVATTSLANPGQPAALISLGEGIKPQYVKWTGNDRYVVSILKPEMSDGVPYYAGHLFTQKLGESTPKVLLRPKFFRQFNNQVVSWLEDDPDHILMSYTTFDSSGGFATRMKTNDFVPYPGVHKVNLNTRRTKTVMSAETGIDDWMADAQGEPRVGTGTSEKGVRSLKIKDPSTGAWKTDSHYPGLERDTPVFAILNAGQQLVIGDYDGRDTLGLFIYDLVKKQRGRKLFQNDVYDARSVIVNRAGTDVIGAQYIADKVETEYLGSYATLADEVRGSLPGFSVRQIDLSDDTKTAIFRISAPYEPGGLYLYRKGDSGPTPIQPAYNGLKADDMGMVVSLSYTSRDGEKIPAYVTLPPTVTETSQIKALPFIVLPHGGPYARDSKTFDYFAQFFASRGYGVMQMNFRGSEGFGKSFAEAGRNNWLVMQQDVEDATRFLLKKGYADPDRTCIAGWSYGGYAALMGAATDQDGFYNCVISMAGLTDIGAAKRDLKKYVGGTGAARTFFGPSMDDRAVRKANSPVNVADKIRVPVFLAHGDEDQNVQFSQFKKMRDALQKAGADATYMAFEREDHYLSRQANREAFFQGLDRFLTKANGPSEYMPK